jgi:hypothetical protein
VLRGCSGLLQRRTIRHIFFEVNTDRMARLGIAQDAAQQLLSAFGYHIEYLAGNDWYARCP